MMTSVFLTRFSEGGKCPARRVAGGAASSSTTHLWEADQGV